MPKNPVFEFLKQQGLGGKLEDERIPIIGGRQPTPSRNRNVILQPFEYLSGHISHEPAIVENIVQHPHPVDVFADSSLFSPSRLNLVRQLLISKEIKVVPAVRAELADVQARPDGPLKSLLFPDGQLHPRIVASGYDAVEKHPYVISRYANLLHLRRRVLEPALKAYKDATSTDAVGAARTKIVNEALRNGISWRTLRLSNKGDARRRYTDEILSTYAVLSPILTGRDAFILTADKDVFDQFYQLTVLLHDDYGSFLIADDFRQNPHRYSHIHATANDAMKAGSLAVGRPKEPTSLVPTIRRTCATTVIDVGTGDAMTWIGIREIERALDFQEQARCARIGDAGNGRNAHISLSDHTCRVASAHFSIGEDMIAIDESTEVGQIQISRFDVMRALTDKAAVASRRQLTWV